MEKGGVLEKLVMQKRDTTWNSGVFRILEESLTSLEDKLSRDFRYLKVNIGCKLLIKIARRQYKIGCFSSFKYTFYAFKFL